MVNYNLKNLVKRLFPESFKMRLRRLENYTLRLRYGFTKPVILKDINGFFFLLQPKDVNPIRWQIERGAYTKECNAMKKVVSAGDIAFDVGANVGIISMFLSQLVGTKGKVFSFEPSPETYTLCTQNIALNNISNIVTQQLAISSEQGVVDFYVDVNNQQLNSLGQVNNGHKILDHRIKVKADTLDSLCKHFKVERIRFLKIDVEGFEPEVLRGAHDILTKGLVDVVQFEISEVPLTSLHKGISDVVSQFDTYGYRVYEYVEMTNTFRPLREIDLGCDNYYASRLQLESI